MHPAHSRSGYMLTLLFTQHTAHRCAQKTTPKEAQHQRRIRLAVLLCHSHTG
ncbi:hypothetical protein BofuT4_uP145880.1 [Botrytis cinerea T4]|uniref:Uncharacterized protein n=1 Tax=Botryotinia fuckeliana (strain T4) TaxID=999810 RepID=G2YXS1_BOTF4|nr:hypothetical protein BofuT4_uP145880.1 [Botrytis cinerea T4]